MEREYKVGDTIYVKSKILQVDEDDDKYPYGVVFSNHDYTDAWISDKVIVEPPAKPTLPKDVADEIEQAKIEVKCFDLYIQTVTNNEVSWYPQSSRYWYRGDGSNTETLLNAWNNGYTVEKQKLYSLVIGYDSDNTDGGTCNALNKRGGGLFIDICSFLDDDLKADPDYQFTQEEIDKYNKNFWIKNFDLNDYKIEVLTDED